ncbi:MAG: hypothetical protein KatS3mg105_0945 [Gemmatales bacterium]|nr:MAG: hypothetical protein KatS3mg105_0945 [Gemmatales bacterium]
MTELRTSVLAFSDSSFVSDFFIIFFRRFVSLRESRSLSRLELVHLDDAFPHARMRQKGNQHLGKLIRGHCSVSLAILASTRDWMPSGRELANAFMHGRLPVESRQELATKPSHLETYHDSANKGSKTESFHQGFHWILP